MSGIWQEIAPRSWRALALLEGKPLTETQLGVRGVELWHAGPSALLLAAPGVWVRVNGQPVLGGLRVLEHRDEVLLPAARLFFSVETTPRVVTYQPAAGERAPTCPICRGPIRQGMQAVQCPGCGRWFHQGEAADGKPGKPCWTYVPTCRFCSHPTSFAAEAAWHPEAAGV
jgi:hypothetical protein